MVSFQQVFAMWKTPHFFPHSTSVSFADSSSPGGAIIGPGTARPLRGRVWREGQDPPLQGDGVCRGGFVIRPVGEAALPSPGEKVAERSEVGCGMGATIGRRAPQRGASLAPAFMRVLQSAANFPIQCLPVAGIP